MAVDNVEMGQQETKKRKKMENKSHSMEDKKHKFKKHKSDKELAVNTGDSVKRNKHGKKRHSIKEGESDIKSDSKQKSDGSSEQPHKRMRQRKDKFKDKVPDFLRLLKTKPPVAKDEPVTAPKTPEEIALEKMKTEKRERMRKKRITKKQNKGKKIETTVAKDSALQYLTLWHTHREMWRFQKVRQVWLLGHMYDTNMVSDSNFDTLLKYLEDLKGNSKDKTTEQAEKILAMAEDEDEKDDEKDDKEKEDEEKEDDEDDNDDESSEKMIQEGEEKSKTKKSDKKSTKAKEDVTTSLKYQRARQILQILA